MSRRCRMQERGAQTQAASVWPRLVAAGCINHVGASVPGAPPLIPSTQTSWPYSRAATPLGARRPLARTRARSLRRQLAPRRRSRRGGRARRAVGRSGAARRARALQDRVHLRRRRVHAALPLGLILRGQGAARLGASRCSTSGAGARGRLRYGAKPFCVRARMLTMPIGTATRPEAGTARKPARRRASLRP